MSEKFLKAFRRRRHQLEESGFIEICIAGSPRSKDTLRIREFFYKNNVPHTFFDIEEDAGRKQLLALKATAEDTPIIACNKHIVKHPSLEKIAECLGITRTVRDELFDVVVIGAGPAGLAAAVYGASEGLKTLVVDKIGPGGQAGQSSRIENYMGFPEGISGAVRWTPIVGQF